jgi:ribosome-binding protein aMBF1 (putative translation factor)
MTLRTFCLAAKDWAVEDLEGFSQIVATGLDICGLSVAEVADELRISLATVLSWKTGATVPADPTRRAVVQFFSARANLIDEKNRRPSAKHKAIGDGRPPF